MTFDEAFDALIGNEGGYSFNAADPGGETMWGVTARVARANGYMGEMRGMPRDMAKVIYERLYWRQACCDDMPAPVRFHVFDAAVNCGTVQAALFVQRAAGVGDDGHLGPVSLAAVNAMAPDRFIRRFTALVMLFRTDLPTWGAFGRGWSKRAANNLLLD